MSALIEKTGLIDKDEVMLRVLLVDDHTILRQGLGKLLASEDGLSVVGEAKDGREAVEKAKELDPDVVITDLAMPQLNGLDSAARILKRRPGTKILVLSMYLDEEYLGKAIEAGVTGYIAKDAPTAELLEAIRTVAQGKPYFASQIPKDLIERLRAEARRPRRRTVELTDREREVMKLLAEGNTVKTVAQILGLSQKTVDTHKTNLMKKLNIHNRVELVKYAINEKLVQL